MTNDYYILDGKTPKRVESVREWAAWYEKADRHVAKHTIGDVTVSTVFLGLDHAFAENERPMLFETMVFGGTHNGTQDRCSTWEEAEAQHARTLALVGRALH